jgi:ankyrin repeat protein
VREIIDAGGDVNLADKDGWSPLIFATFGGQLDIVKLLIESGSNCYHINNVGHNAIQFAEARKYDDIVTELKKCLIDNVDKQQQTNQIQQQQQQQDVTNIEKKSHKSYSHNSKNDNSINDNNNKHNNDNNNNNNNINNIYNQEHPQLILIPILLEIGTFLLFLKFIYFLGFRHGIC